MAGRDGAAWADYWQGARSDTRAMGHASLSEELDRFWAERISALLQESVPARVGDLACGAAPVLARFCECAEAVGWRGELAAIDISSEALALAREAMAPRRVELICAPADDTGLDAGSFDLLFSQFGLEYAGPSAFDEVARLLAPGGRFLSVVHAKEGGIFAESAANLAVLDALDEIAILDDIKDLLASTEEAGSAARSRAERRLSEKVERFGRFLQTQSPGAAREFARRLVNDAVTLYNRREAYVPKDRDHWLAHQAGAIAAYRGRMTSMMRAALDEDALNRVVGRWREAGLSAQAEPFLPKEGGKQLGWILAACLPARRK